MLELTCLGHATLLVQSTRTAILCDPILGDAACGGGNVFHPRRTVHADRLPVLDAILISHHHSDHFSLPDLARIPSVRGQRILAPERSDVIDKLRRFGCTRVEALRVGEPVEIGDITVTPTPSAVEFPEVGFLFRSDGDTALSLVDTQIHGVIDHLLRILDGPVQLALAPYQAGGYMSLLPLRVGGPPDGLIEAISRWSREYTDELVADLSLIRPQYVVPFADGLVYHDKGINAWHFPLPDDTFLNRMASVGISGEPSVPGSVFGVSSSGVATRADRSVMVTAEPHHVAERFFDPSVRLSDIPMTCADWNPALRDAANGTKWDHLCAALRDRVAANVSARTVISLPPPADPFLHWFLEFCDRPNEMIYLFIDRGAEDLQVRLGAERPPYREYGLRLYAADLMALTEGSIQLEHITLGGAFRYHSPRAVDDLERIRRRVFGPLYAILGME